MSIKKSIDFNTNNVILVFYPSGSGGKFLINCLSLADNCILLFDSKKSYQTKTSQNEKNSLILDRLSQVGDTWNDLMFGSPETYYDSAYVMRLNDQVKKVFDTDLSNPEFIHKFYQWNDVYIELCNSKNKFILPCYSVTDLFFYKTVWTNAKIIYFENSFKFVKKYRKKYIDSNKNTNSNLLQYVYPVWKEYKKIKGLSWPKFPTSIDDWENIPDNVIEEIKSIDPMLLSKIKNSMILTNFYQELKKSNDIFFWNTNNYFVLNKFVPNIKKLYNFLELTNLNTNMIVNYYNTYTNKINQLSQLKKINYNQLSYDQLKFCKKKLINDINNCLLILDFKTANYKLIELEKIIECCQKRSE